MSGIEPDAEAQNTIIDDRDSAFDGSSANSVTETLDSIIARGVIENGRTYASYGKQEYCMPMDEEELDRIDLSHAKYLLLLEGKLFLAPISDHVQNVLDLGTGTGIWAIDMADKYPSAGVVGVDIAPTQPHWVPPNCLFEIDDVEMDWTFKQSSFDFIHSRDLMFSIRDWPRLTKQAFDHIKPGGYIELQCIHTGLRCDDGSSPPDSALQKFADLGIEFSATLGIPGNDPERYAGFLESAGFVDIVEQRFKVPSSPWAKDKRLKLVGAYELQNLLFGLRGMVLRMFSRMGWTTEEIEVFLVEVRKALKNMSYHTYYEL